MSTVLPFDLPFCYRSRAVLDKQVRLFRVSTFGDAQTGPLDHASRLVATRAEFRANLKHVHLSAGQSKDVVGAWCPVEALTREQGGTKTTRAGREYDLPSQVGRHLENVTGSSASTFLDVDKLPVAKWPLLLSKLQAYSGEIWSTASYASNAPTLSFRVHLHLSRELASREEVEGVRRSLSAQLGGVADPACLQPVSIFYLPVTRGESFIELLDGAEVDVDSLPVVPRPRSRRAQPVPVGYEPTPKDLERAAEELESLSERIRTCDRGLRKYAELAALSVGQRIAAGVLDIAAATKVLETALSEQRRLHGDDVCSLEERFEQLASGIADGIARGPALTPDRATPKELLLEDVAAKPEWIPADAAAAANPPGHILALPPGVGKSRAALLTISRSRQNAVVYSPSHALAEEHRETLLAFGVPADDIYHAMSPLHRPAGGEEGCERSRASRSAETPEGESSPFAEAVRGAGLNLRASICPRCPLKDTCLVRFGQPSRARIKLAVHAAYEPVEDPGKVLTYLDEEPPPLELLSVTRRELDALAGRSAVYESLTGAAHAFWTPGQVRAETASRIHEADLAGEELAPFDPGQGYYVRQAALALRGGRQVPEEIRAGLASYAGDVRLAPHVADALLANPAGGLSVETSDLAPVRAVLKMGSAIVRAQENSLNAVIETDSRRDIRRGYAVLLSATPTPMAYGDIPVYAPAVADGCAGVERHLLYLSRGSNLSFRVDPQAQIERCRELLEGVSFAGQRILVVTFKSIVASHPDALRSLFPEADVELRWFGAVAGSNRFQEGGELEVSAVVTLGDYFANRRWMFEHLVAEAGLTGDDALEALDAAGQLQVRQELAQAHGRARDPRRTKPVVHLHVGQILPLGWEGRVSKPVFLEERRAAERQACQEEMYANLVDGCRCLSQAVVERRLGVGRRQIQRWWNKTREIPLKYRQLLLDL